MIVDVIQCFECKHRGKSGCPFHIDGSDPEESFLKQVDGNFCSYGELADDSVRHVLSKDDFRGFRQVIKALSAL